LVGEQGTGFGGERLVGERREKKEERREMHRRENFPREIIFYLINLAGLA
jgi:hypothetical protein